MANDGWASDYLRQLNTQGPGNPGNIVSSKVQYVPPVVQTEARTNDTPMYTEDDARGAYVAPASGYRAPAGGGYTAQTFPHETAGRRYARSKGTKSRASKPAGKQTQPDSKQQPQPEYRTGGARTPEENEITRSAAEHRAGADLGQLNSQALDAAARFLPALKLLLGFGAGAGSADTASTDRPSYMGAAGTMADNFARTLPQPSAASRQTDPESSSIEGQFKNMPWYEDAKAHHETVKKNMDDYGSALGTLKSTWDDIPWWTKLVMLPPVFKAGSPAAGASTTGNVWAEGGRAAAGDATAGAKAFEESLSRMNGGAVRGAPVEGAARRSFSSAGTATGTEAAGSAGEAAAGSRSFGFDLSPGEIASARASQEAFRSNLAELHSSLIRSGMPEREAAAYMREAGFYNNPEALQQAVFTIRKHGPSGLFERSADEAAAAGTYIPKYGKSPLETWQQERAATEAANAKFRDMFGFDLGQAAGRGSAGEAAAGSRSFRFDMSPEEAARARASHEAFIRDAAAGRGQAAAGGQAAGRGSAGEAAADGGVSELANAGNAGRSSADEAMEVAKRLDELVRSIESGKVDEMGKAWIEALANQKAAGFESEAINYILDTARAAGVIK